MHAQMEAGTAPAPDVTQEEMLVEQQRATTNELVLELRRTVEVCDSQIESYTNARDSLAAAIDVAETRRNAAHAALMIYDSPKVAHPGANVRG